MSLASSDEEAIQGLWRLVSCVRRGDSIATVATHYHFDGSRLKQIAPSEVDGGEWETFALDSRAQPKRLTRTSEWIDKDGNAVCRVERLLYDLHGDTLRICSPSVFGRYPDVFSDAEHSVTTLMRYVGPPPQTKQPSGRMPIEDAVLGRLDWNDNLDWWEARIDWEGGGRVDVYFTPDEGREGDVTLASGLVIWLRQHDEAVRTFAAAQLLETHNESGWNEGAPISARQFVDRLTLESIAVLPDGDASLDYHAGDLFWGHCVSVSIDKDRQFEDASI